MISVGAQDTKARQAATSDHVSVAKATKFPAPAETYSCDSCSPLYRSHSAPAPVNFFHTCSLLHSNSFNFQPTLLRSPL